MYNLFIINFCCVFW